MTFVASTGSWVSRSFVLPLVLAAGVSAFGCSSADATNDRLGNEAVGQNAAALTFHWFFATQIETGVPGVKDAIGLELVGGEIRLFFCGGDPSAPSHTSWFSGPVKQQPNGQYYGDLRSPAGHTTHVEFKLPSNWWESTVTGTTLDGGHSWTAKFIDVSDGFSGLYDVFLTNQTHDHIGLVAFDEANLGSWRTTTPCKFEAWDKNSLTAKPPSCRIQGAALLPSRVELVDPIGGRTGGTADNPGETIVNTTFKSAPISPVLLSSVALHSATP